MSESPDDDTRRPPSGISRTAAHGASADGDTDVAPDALVELLRRSADEVIDELCAGRPFDLQSRCEAHAADCAYLLEEGRVAAKVIARLASLAGAPGGPELDDVDGLIAFATAEALEEGPLEAEALELKDDPLEDDPPIFVRLCRYFGLSMERVIRLVPRLNALDPQDRHVVFHCAALGLSPEEYAERFDDERRVVEGILDQVPGLVR